MEENMEVLDYSEMEREVVDWMERTRLMVLSTCAATEADRQVTARSMSTIHHAGKVYFQTGPTTTKFDQIRQNPLVALCAGNVQVEGMARPLAHPLAPESRFFAEKYSELHPGSFKIYSHLPSNVVIEVTPRRITFWKYTEDGKPYRDFVDFAARTACREMYSLE
jgi:general stress protein 26